MNARRYLSKWDVDLSPCPQCDGNMTIDSNHPIADVDCGNEQGKDEYLVYYA